MRITSSRPSGSSSHHRGHHHPRRGAADGAGQLRLDELHQPRVGRDAASTPATPGAPRVVVEQRAARAPRPGSGRPAASRSATCGAAAPEHRAGAGGALEDVDEQQRLAGLARRRRAPQRHRHVERRRWPAGSRTANGSGCPGRAGRTAARAAAAPMPNGPVRQEAGRPASPTWRATAASACRPRARSRPAARPARRRACRPSSTCRPAAPARTAPPRQS